MPPPPFFLSIWIEADGGKEGDSVGFSPGMQKDFERKGENSFGGGGGGGDWGGGGLIV